MILSFVILWPVFQVSASWLCLLIPLEKLDYTKGIYRARRWESKRFYKRFLKVDLWKKFLPDGAAITKAGFQKKRLVATDPAYLSRFLAESCRAELGHWLAILPFWVFGFWAPPTVLLPMLLYALAVNLPCIIAQRYNRPRVAHLLNKSQHIICIK